MRVSESLIDLIYNECSVNADIIVHNYSKACLQYNYLRFKFIFGSHTVITHSCPDILQLKISQQTSVTGVVYKHSSHLLINFVLRNLGSYPKCFLLLNLKYAVNFFTNICYLFNVLFKVILPFKQSLKRPPTTLLTKYSTFYI